MEAEREQRDSEAALYDRLPGLRVLSLAEIPLTLAALRITPPNLAGAPPNPAGVPRLLGRSIAGGIPPSKPGTPTTFHPEDRLLEVGCGTGRFTTRLAGKCGAIIAIDHSLESLRILSRKLSGRAGSIQLVQGDATRLPVREHWATRVLSSQVLEHLPSERARADAVAEMARALEPGGRAVISVYWHTPGLRWLLRRDGRHSGTIPYYRFSRCEFARLLEPHFTFERLTGRLVYLLLASTVRRA